MSEDDARDAAGWLMEGLMQPKVRVRVVQIIAGEIRHADVLGDVGEVIAQIRGGDGELTLHNFTFTHDWDHERGVAEPWTVPARAVTAFRIVTRDVPVEADEGEVRDSNPDAS